jgi:hypothetical protein
VLPVALVAVVVKCKPVLSRQCRTFQSLKLTQDKGLFQCQLMADSALAVLGRFLWHALAVTADVTLRAALSAADNPTITARAVEARAAGATAHSVTAGLRFGAARAAAAGGGGCGAADLATAAGLIGVVAAYTSAKGLAAAALGFVVSATKSRSGLAQAERSQYCASDGAADQAQHFSP